MLHKDKFVFSALSESHRYTLCVIVLQALMVFFFIIDEMSIFSAFFRYVSQYICTLTCISSPSATSFGRLFVSLTLFGMTVPGQVFVDLFLYNLKRPNIAASIICIISSTLVCILASMNSLIYLGAFGAAASLLQLFTSAQWIPTEQIQQFFA